MRIPSLDFPVPSTTPLRSPTPVRTEPAPKPVVLEQPLAPRAEGALPVAPSERPSGLSLVSLRVQQQAPPSAVRGVEERAPAPAQTLATLFAATGDRLHLNAQELQMRFSEPLTLLAGFDDRGLNGSCRAAYGDLRDRPWGASCGQTSLSLKHLISDAWTAGRGVDALIAAINDPANTHVRVQIGCHSFVIENRDDSCRLYQSYMAMGFGGYTLQRSLTDDAARPRADFVARLREVFEARTNHEASVDLFHGTCDPRANASGDEVFKVDFEATQAPRPDAEIGRRLGALIESNHAAWETVRTSRESVRGYLGWD